MRIGEITCLLAISLLFFMRGNKMLLKFKQMDFSKTRKPDKNNKHYPTKLPLQLSSIWTVTVSGIRLLPWQQSLFHRPLWLFIFFVLSHVIFLTSSWLFLIKPRNNRLNHKRLELLANLLEIYRWTDWKVSCSQTVWLDSWRGRVKSG